MMEGYGTKTQQATMLTMNKRDKMNLRILAFTQREMHARL